MAFTKYFLSKVVFHRQLKFTQIPILWGTASRNWTSLQLEAIWESSDGEGMSKSSECTAQSALQCSEPGEQRSGPGNYKNMLLEGGRRGVMEGKKVLGSEGGEERKGERKEGDIKYYALCYGLQ